MYCALSNRHNFFFLLFLSMILYRIMLSRHIYLLKTININRLTPQSNLFIDISVSFFFLFFLSRSLPHFYLSIFILFVSVECTPACPLHFCSHSFSCRSVEQSDQQNAQLPGGYVLLSLLDIYLWAMVTTTVTLPIVFFYQDEVKL